jgi:hypothetical protein
LGDIFGWENNIKMDLEEIGFKWLRTGSSGGWSFVDTMMKFQVP